MHDAQYLDALNAELERVLHALEILNDTSRNVSQNSPVQLTQNIANECRRLNTRTMREIHTLQMRIRNLSRQ